MPAVMSSTMGRAASAMKWGGVSQVGRQLLQLVTLVVLARLLGPKDFGLMGMAAVFVGFIAVFKDLGVAAAVVQRRELTQSLLSTVYWINVGLGLLAAVSLTLIAPLVADLYHQPRVTGVLRALSIGFALSGLAVLQQTLFERQLRMRRLAVVEVFSAALGSAVAILVAAAGWGVWSLVVLSLVTAATNSLLLWLWSTWRPSLSFSSADLRSLLHFTLNLAGFNVVNYFVRNADNFVVGRYLGSQPLGYYSMAYRILLFPLVNISSVAERVMFPVFSRVQDDLEKLRRGFLLTARAIALVTFPLMCGVFALRRPFVLAVFGEKWLPLIKLVAILAPVGLVQSVITVLGAVYLARGRTDIQFIYGTITGVMAVGAFIVGLHWGVTGVAAAYAIFVAVTIYPCLAIPFGLIKLRFRVFLRALSTIGLASATMCGALIGVQALLPAGTSPTLTLLLLVPAGGALYLLILRIIDKRPLAEVVAALRSRSGPLQAPGEE
jgi:O-antigen/teichoic acid export membrane protein